MWAGAARSAAAKHKDLGDRTLRGAPKRTLQGGGARMSDQSAPRTSDAGTGAQVRRRATQAHAGRRPRATASHGGGSSSSARGAVLRPPTRSADAARGDASQETRRQQRARTGAPGARTMPLAATLRRRPRLFSPPASGEVEKAAAPPAAPTTARAKAVRLMCIAAILESLDVMDFVAQMLNERFVGC